MGRVASTLKRPFMNWNVENRAQKVIEKQQKPKMAPRHPSSQEIIDTFSREHPEFLEEQKKRNEHLDEMLKGLVVEPQKFGAITSKKKALPEDRSRVEDLEFGYLEPETIRPGRFSIRQAMQFLGDHYTDPENNTVAAIAKRYNLDEGQVERILRYFSVFLVQIPGQNRGTDASPETRALKPSFFKKALKAGMQRNAKDGTQTVTGSPEPK